METLQKKSIFWDVDPHSLNLRVNAGFVIGRVLDFGDIDDYRWLVKVYGTEKIRDYVSAEPQLEPKSLFFWQNYFNLQTSLWSSKQSTNKPGAFSKR